MKIALIQPNSSFLHEPLSLPSLGLLYISSYLKKHGFEPKLYDFTGRDGNETEHMLNKISSENYDIIAFTCQTPHFLQVIDMKEKLQSEAKFVIGGPYATYNHEECINHNFTAVIGEGEHSMLKICNGDNSLMFENNTDKINTLLPDWDAIDINRYKYHLDGKKCMSIMTTRGKCPFKCIFCSKAAGGKLRFRSASSVIEEIKLLRNKYEIKAIAFYDDTMLLNKKRDYEIFKCLKRLGMPFRFMTRSDVVSERDLEFVKHCGCAEICIGIESADNEILKTIKKGTTIERDTWFVNKCKEIGLRVKTYFIIGLPGEGFESVTKMKVWLMKNKPDNYDISIYVPYPGSYLYNNKDKYDIQWNDEKLKDMWFGGTPQYDNVSAVRTSKLSYEDIVMLRNEIFEEFPRGTGGSTPYWGVSNGC